MLKFEPDYCHRKLTPHFSAALLNCIAWSASITGIDATSTIPLKIQKPSFSMFGSTLRRLSSILAPSITITTKAATQSFGVLHKKGPAQRFFNQKAEGKHGIGDQVYSIQAVEVLLNVPGTTKTPALNRRQLLSCCCVVICHDAMRIIIRLRPSWQVQPLFSCRFHWVKKPPAKQIQPNPKPRRRPRPTGRCDKWRGNAVMRQCALNLRG